jgi:type I restriction enzyme S subunit
MSEWNIRTLGELVEIIPGFAFKGEEFGKNGTSVIKIKDINPPKVNLLNAEKVDITKYPTSKLSKYRLLKGQAVLAMTGATIGKIGRLKIDAEVFINQRVAKLGPKDGVDYEFVIYSISGDEFQTFIQNNIDSNSAQENISASSIGRFEILLPPLPEQRAIASILSSLDDKIDLLHRQNATLEKMAEALFRQWFVEEAKEEWELGKVSNYAIHYKDSLNPQKHPSVLFTHYSIPSFDNCKEPVRELGASIQSNKYKVPKHCILFSKLNPHKDKRLWLILDEVDEDAICSTEFQVVEPKHPRYLYFLYGWLNHYENYTDIASGVGGTSGSHQRIDPRTIFSFQCPLISNSQVDEFNVVVEPLFKKQLINQTQIRSLTALRDTLLPKLMSGEVRVNQINH